MTSQLLGFGEFACRVMGILPLEFDREKGRVSYTRANLFFQLFWLSTVLLFSPIGLKWYLMPPDVPWSKDFTMKAVIQIFNENLSGSVQHLMILLFTFTKRHTIVDLVNKILRLRLEFFGDTSLESLGTDLTKKNLVINTYIVFLNVHEFYVNREKSLLEIVTIFLNYLAPIFIIRATATVVYSGIALFNLYFETINKKLEDAVEAMNTRNSRSRKKFQRFQLSCDFSDFIDRICVIHGGLVKLALSYNRIFNFLLMLLFANSFISIITRVNILTNIFRFFINRLAAVVFYLQRFGEGDCQQERRDEFVGDL